MARINTTQLIHHATNLGSRGVPGPAGPSGPEGLERGRPRRRQGGQVGGGGGHRDALQHGAERAPMAVPASPACWPERSFRTRVRDLQVPLVDRANVA